MFHGGRHLSSNAGCQAHDGWSKRYRQQEHKDNTPNTATQCMESSIILPVTNHQNTALTMALHQSLLRTNDIHQGTPALAIPGLHVALTISGQHCEKSNIARPRSFRPKCHLARSSFLHVTTVAFVAGALCQLDFHLFFLLFLPFLSDSQVHSYTPC